MKKKSAKSKISAYLKDKRGAIIGTCVFAVVVVAVVLVFALFKNEVEEEKIILARSYEGKDTPYVLDNGKLTLSVDPENTHITVTNKATGMEWKSNPDNILDDPKALPLEKNKLNSTIILTYSTQNGVDTEYNNYQYGIESKLYEIEQGNDYIKVLYSIGSVEKEFVIPPAIKDADLQVLMANLSKSEATKITDYYKKYDVNNLSGKDKDNKSELLERFPILETEVIWILRDTTKNTMKGKLEEYFANAGYTLEAWQEDKLLDTSVSVSTKPVFNVSVIYKLEDNDLVVEVPFNEIEYKEKYPIYRISLLPYFGAGYTDDEGFMVVPEGGGAIINFNNGKTAQTNYYANMYGWDDAQDRTAVVHDTRTYYNMFGVAKNGESFICMAEDGSAYGAVQADISGKVHSYNYANIIYQMMHREQYNVGDRTTSDMYVYEENLPDESIVQRYRFMDTDSYVDMATEYGNYMRQLYAGQLTKNTDTQAPVVVDILGAVDKTEQILGVPVLKPLALTTYKDAENIVTELYNAGFNNMNVKYSGWANGGVEQKLMNKVSLIGRLGNKKELQNMISSANNLGVKVYLNGITNYAYNSGMAQGFSKLYDSARFVSKDRAKLYPYSTVAYDKSKWREEYYLLKPSLISDCAKNLVNAAKKYNASVSFDDYGYKLSADYNLKNRVSREAALNTQAGELAAYKAEGNSIMINMGNDYAIPYADIVTNMDLEGVAYTIIDKKIPFYQIALHGYVTYTGESLNLAQNAEDELLRSAEYGAGLAFTFMKESSFLLQNTYYTRYFGAEYAGWKNQAAEIYTRYNKELGHTFNQTIVDHKFETATLTCTTYEDGTKVYVNYGYEEQTAADGTKVPERDYKVVR